MTLKLKMDNRIIIYQNLLSKMIMQIRYDSDERHLSVHIIPNAHVFMM